MRNINNILRKFLNDFFLTKLILLVASVLQLGVYVYIYSLPQVLLCQNNSRNYSVNNKILDKTAREVAENNIWIETCLNNYKPYKRETIIVDYYLIINPEVLLQDVKSVILPSFYSFKSKEISLGELKYHDTIIDNKILFKKALLHRYLLTPQKSGECKVDKLKMQFELRLPLEKKSSDANMYDDYYELIYDASSKEKIIQVQELPIHEKKYDFVGDFSIDFSVSKITARTDENILISVNISGIGSLSDAFVPTIKKTEGLKTNIYKSRDSFDVNSNILTSWKTYEVDLISTISGGFFINPIEFFCFSPTSKKHYTLKTDGITVFYLDEDEDLSNNNSKSSLIKIISITITIIITILLVFLVVFYKKNIKKYKTIRYKKKITHNEYNNKYNTKRNKYLDVAANTMNAELDIFLKNLVCGIDDFLEDTFEIKKNKLSSEEIYNLLLEKGISENLARNYKIMCQKIDEIRFSSKQTFVDKEKLYLFVENFLEQF